MLHSPGKKHNKKTNGNRKKTERERRDGQKGEQEGRTERRRERASPTIRNVSARVLRFVGDAGIQNAIEKSGEPAAFVDATPKIDAR